MQPTITEIATLIIALATLGGSYLAWRRYKPEANKTGAETSKLDIDASASAAEAIKTYSDEIVRLRNEMQARETDFKQKIEAMKLDFQRQFDELNDRLTRAEERAERAERMLKIEANYSMQLTYQLKSHDLTPIARPKAVE